MAKKQDKKLTKKRAQTMFKSRLGGDTSIPAPKGYTCWVSFFMEKQTPIKPFKSWTEIRAFEYANRVVDADYEPFKIPYTIKRETNYVPDIYFMYNEVTYIGEVKGRFRTADEAKKYIDFRRCNPDIVLFFILERANTALFGAKKRKDGTRRSMEEWIEKNDFEYTYVEELQQYLHDLVGGNSG